MADNFQQRDAAAECKVVPTMSEAAQRWSVFEPEFYRDGTLRDIYVLNTQLQDWVAAINFVRSLVARR